MNKPSGLEKIYLFPSPFSKTFIESQSWMTQADKSDTVTPGISKSVLIKSSPHRQSAAIQQWSCIGYRADPQMTRNTLATRAATFHIDIFRAYTKNTLTFTPSSIVPQREGTQEWKQAWEFRLAYCIIPENGVNAPFNWTPNYNQERLLITPTFTIEMKGALPCE